MLSSLLLNDSVVESICIRTNLDRLMDREDNQTAEVDVQLDILRTEGAPRFLIPLTVRLNQRKEDFERNGFALNLRILGYFSFRDELDEKQTAQLISLNAPSILYGVARGVAAQAFAMTPVGRFLLPSVNFVEIMQQRDRRRRTKRQTLPTNTTNGKTSTS